SPSPVDHKLLTAGLMLTQRGWWLLLTLGAMLGLGTLGSYSSASQIAIVSQIAIALLLWFSWEWLRFAVSVRMAARALRADREIWDARGPVTALWAGRSFDVRVTLRLGRGPGLAYVVADDPVPFGLEYVGGDPSVGGELRAGGTLSLRYDVRAGMA